MRLDSDSKRAAAGAGRTPGARHRRSMIIPVTVGIIVIGLLTGCRDYFDRKDTISLGVGNAVAENKAVQTIDPWPPGVFKKHQTTDGKRLEKAIERYWENKPPERSIEQSITRND